MTSRAPVAAAPCQSAVAGEAPLTVTARSSSRR